jgi:hypothetical protein
MPHEVGILGKQDEAPLLRFGKYLGVGGQARQANIGELIYGGKAGGQ